MHIAATEPKSLTPDNLDETIIEREKAIYREQLNSSGKPPEIIEKIIINLDSYCRFTDQDGNLFTQYNSRKGNQLIAGSGNATFIEGQNKWKYLINFLFFSF